VIGGQIGPQRRVCLCGNVRGAALGGRVIETDVSCASAAIMIVARAPGVARAEGGQEQDEGASGGKGHVTRPTACKHRSSALREGWRARQRPSSFMASTRNLTRKRCHRFSRVAGLGP
jgi:hypothetical protein